MTKTIDADAILNRAKPLVHQHAHEIHPYGHLVKLPIAHNRTSPRDCRPRG
jgi:hypothetical protein